MGTRSVDRGRPGGMRGAVVRMASALAVAVLGVGAFGALPAAADGPTTFSSLGAINVPAVGSPNQIGAANPYPSSVAVSGMSGLVSKVTVTLNGVTHSIASDIDALLVAPTGANIILMSDAASGGAFSASNVTLTIDDAALSALPPAGNLSTGSFRPTNIDPGDVFPAPAPAPSAQTTLAGAFTGINPNGTWQLFIVDDATGDVGSIAGGWSLSITTDVIALPTVTSVTTSGTPSATGDAVTFTATVTQAGSPVTTGTVQFRDGVTPIGSAVPLSAAGSATVTTSTLTEGTHNIRAEYNGATGLLTSNAVISQRVDNPTIVSGNTYCNTGALSIPSSGTAAPYPSNITVTGAVGSIVAVTATLHGLAHEFPVDLDIMLSGPSPATNLLLMSDAGGNVAVTDVDITFDDAAASGVPVPLVDGSFRPTNVAGDGPDIFPAPAPVPSAATSLAAFAGTDANGTWSLWVVDGAPGDSGSIAGGWCLTITTQEATTTAVTSSVNPSSAGQSVTFTATVTAGSSPVTTGTVQFADGVTPLGAPVPVAANGTATFTTSALTVGTHTISGAYSGTAALAESSGTLSQVVDRVSTSTVVTSDLNPSTSGDSVTFTASVAAGGSPVTTGTVEFTDGAAVLASGVALAADGTATFTTSALTVGTHTITATYSGTATLAGGSDTLDQIVDALVIADAGGPYTIAEGESLTLDGTGSTSGATYEWDVNGDGVYGDAGGAAPTLTWADLDALGIDDGPASHAVVLRVVSGQQSVTDATTLDVTNTAPDTIVTGDLNATAGTEFTVKVGADDPSSSDLAAQFTYEVDWGDGTAVETVTGPADPPVSHTYATGGSYSAAFVAIDKDGGRSAGVVVTVEVADAPSPTPSPTPSPEPEPLPPTGVDVTAPLAIGAGLLVVGLTFLLLRRVPRRR